MNSSEADQSYVRILHDLMTATRLRAALAGADGDPTDAGSVTGGDDGRSLTDASLSTDGGGSVAATPTTGGLEIGDRFDAGLGGGDDSGRRGRRRRRKGTNVEKVLILDCRGASAAYGNSFKGAGTGKPHHTCSFFFARVPCFSSWCFGSGRVCASNFYFFLPDGLRRQR